MCSSILSGLFAALQQTHQQFRAKTNSVDLDVLGFVPLGVFGLLVDLLLGDGSMSLLDFLDDPGRFHFESVDKSRSYHLSHCTIAV